MRFDSAIFQILYITNTNDFLWRYFMSVTMYQASIPVLKHKLNNLSGILQKGLAYADSKKIEHEVFINARLAPDMFPLVKQIQIASDTAKGCAARLAGIDIPAFADNETTFVQLQERIKKTINFLDSVAPEQINGSETRQIILKFPNSSFTFDGQTYLLNFVWPNFYFHMTIAYAILRHNGVDLGKMDFIGNS